MGGLSVTAFDLQDLQKQLLPDITRSAKKPHNSGIKQARGDPGLH